MTPRTPRTRTIHPRLRLLALMAVAVGSASVITPPLLLTLFTLTPTQALSYTIGSALVVAGGVLAVVLGPPQGQVDGLLAEDGER